jgi:hypothetical protein
MAYRRSLRLVPSFYEPFSILHKVGEVAYELDLSLEARIHRVFHVSQLKPKLGSAFSALPKLLPVDANGVLRPELVEVLDRRAHPKDNRPYTELLVCWDGQSADDATWEEFYGLKNAYPHVVGKVL